MIPVIDCLDKFLNDQAINPACLPAIQAACALAKKLLNKYYSKTDESDIYWIARSTCVYYFVHALYLCRLKVLHPCHKFDYFKRAKWQPAWIAEAQELVEAAWERTYVDLPTEINNPAWPPAVDTRQKSTVRSLELTHNL